MEYESLSFLNLRHALQFVEIAKQPRMEQKSDLVAAAAAAFRTLWQKCHTPSSTDNESLDPRVTHIKQLLNDKQELILETLAKVPNALKNVARSYWPQNLVLDSLNEKQ